MFLLGISQKHGNKQKKQGGTKMKTFTKLAITAVIIMGITNGLLAETISGNFVGYVVEIKGEQYTNTLNRDLWVCTNQQTLLPGGKTTAGKYSEKILISKGKTCQIPDKTLEIGSGDTIVIAGENDLENHILVIITQSKIINYFSGSGNNVKVVEDSKTITITLVKYY